VKGIIPCSMVIALAWISAANADHRMTDAQKKVLAKVMEQANSDCAKRGQVALAQNVYGAFAIKCVPPDDPAYKAQQAEQDKPSK